MKYSDRFVDLLVKNGYTTVFYVAGGNIMHILNSCRTRLNCIPVVHEVSAVIAAEYFNETSDERAFALVTAGPGLTNCVTGIAGAWLESRGVLIVGGQVKSSDLMLNSGVRQNGIQELDGIEIVKSICKAVIRIDKILPDDQLLNYTTTVFADRPGPVFMEFCLDVQAFDVEDFPLEHLPETKPHPIRKSIEEVSNAIGALLINSKRPLVLIGGGVSRNIAPAYLGVAERLRIPVMTTWNAADRVPSNHPLYFGRPNTWGQRGANIILQQADLVIAIGTRLGLQQTGFNWEGFVPKGLVVQVDIDKFELEKGHPHIELGINTTTEEFLESFSQISTDAFSDTDGWVQFATEIRELCPLNEKANSAHDGFINPYEFVEILSRVAPNNSQIIPCSSGGAFTTMMQGFQQKYGQRIVTNKGLASMGYGLAGAIGAATANPDRAVILVEGDGGFSQNLQDLGTVASSQLPVKIFIYSNEGYASIRMTQLNYFDGNYMGCDVSTGLGLPDWEKIALAFNISFKILSLDFMMSGIFNQELNDGTPRMYIVPVHKEQTYFPKITSIISENGQMVSNPLHLMTPPLEESIASQVFRYI
jgi:acetolactate synthase-1/2/3 large subunit